MVALTRRGRVDADVQLHNGWKLVTVAATGSNEVPAIFKRSKRQFISVSKPLQGGGLYAKGVADLSPGLFAVSLPNGELPWVKSPFRGLR
jgi:hypothetical protein